MKIIILIFIVVFFYSCNKESKNEINESKNEINESKNEINESKNEINESKNININTIKTPQKTNDKQIKEKIDNLLTNYEKLTNTEKTKIECQNIFKITEDNNNLDKNLLKNSISKCNDIKNIAIKELYIKESDIRKCEILKEVYKNIPNQINDKNKKLLLEIEKCDE